MSAGFDLPSSSVAGRARRVGSLAATDEDGRIAASCKVHLREGA